MVPSAFFMLLAAYYCSAQENLGAFEETVLYKIDTLTDRVKFLENENSNKESRIKVLEETVEILKLQFNVTIENKQEYQEIFDGKFHMVDCANPSKMEKSYNCTFLKCIWYQDLHYLIMHPSFFINPIPTEGGPFGPEQHKTVWHFHSFMAGVTKIHDFVHFSICLVPVKLFWKEMKFQKI